MRLSQITGLPVVDTHIARQAGVVSDVLLDLHTGRVAVLNVQQLPDNVATDSVVAVITNVLASNNITCTGCVETPIAGLNGGANSAVTVRVGVPYEFMLLGPVMALGGQSLGGGAITLRSAAVMRNE